MKPGDERVMAYVDGELDAAGIAEVEAAMATDPAVYAAVSQARALRSQLRQAFAPMLEEPVPERLRAVALGRGPAVAAAPAVAVALPVPRRRRWGLPEWAAMAASLVLGIAVSQLAPGRAAGPLVSDDGRLLAAGPLAVSLEARLGAETGEGLRIGLSFRDREGGYCRGFQLGDGQAVAGLACRASDGRWEVPVLVTIPAAPAGGLRQASTPLPDAVLAEVDRRIAGEPLDAAGERAARDAGWR
mgnify:FL=1